MPYDLTIPFYAVRLRLSTSGSFLAPLLDNNCLRINESLELVSGRYVEQFQRKVLNRGNYRSLLNEYAQGDFYKGRIALPFSAAQDKISFPAFRLDFDYYLSLIHISEPTRPY